MEIDVDGNKFTFERTKATSRKPTRYQPTDGQPTTVSKPVQRQSVELHQRPVVDEQNFPSLRGSSSIGSGRSIGGSNVGSSGGNHKINDDKLDQLINMVQNLSNSNKEVKHRLDRLEKKAAGEDQQMDEANQLDYNQMDLVQRLNQLDDKVKQLEHDNTN